MAKKSGPKPKGYVILSVRLPVYYVAAMKAVNSECGGGLSVNEQIRRAVRSVLCGLVYSSLVKS